MTSHIRGAWLCAAFVFLTACGTPAAPAADSNAAPTTSAAPSSSATVASAECRTIEHEAGATEICGTPQKIVALGPHMLDILLSLGGQPAGYGEAAQLQQTNYGKPAEQIEYLGSRVTTQPVNVGTRDQPSLETLAALDPDLILGEFFSEEDTYDQLSQIAPTTMFTGPDRDDWQQTIGPIANALGVPERAQQVIDAHRERIAAAREELAPLVAEQQVMLLADPGRNAGYDSYVFNETSFAGGILDDLGVTLYEPQPTLLSGEDGDQIALESLAQTEPDTIIVMTSGENTPEQAMREWAATPTLANLRAVREGNVHFVDYQLWSRIRGPIAAELLIEEVRTLLADE